MAHHVLRFRDAALVLCLVVVRDTMVNGKLINTGINAFSDVIHRVSYNHLFVRWNCFRLQTKCSFAHSNVLASLLHNFIKQ